MDKQNNKSTMLEEKIPDYHKKRCYLNPSFELTRIKIEMNITQSSGTPNSMRARVYEDWDTDVEIDGGEISFWD